MGGGVTGHEGGEDGLLYQGHVTHKRARPRRHSLRYSVFTFLIDLEKIENLAARLKLFSVNRWNLFSIRFKDFGARDGSSPAQFARRRAQLAGIAHKVSRVRMLCYPRILGYAFNPITTYFLEDSDGKPVMMIYEVRNTFGEHHFYERVVTGDTAVVAPHNATKAFYVSPFNTLAGQYRFSIRMPGASVFTGITLSDSDGGLLTAWFEGKRREINDLMLLRIALAYPLMTVKIMLGIHWEAFKLWLKGVPHTLGLRSKSGRSIPPAAIAGDDARRGMYE